MVAQSKRTYLSAPDVGTLEEEAVVRAVRSGWVAPLGPEVDAFEAEMTAYVSSGFGVALSSGTAALHLGLLALGVKPGDMVITSSMTFVATANAITYTGAMPVFVDSLDNGTPDVSLIQLALEECLAQGKRVGAIVPVDIYGRSANYSAIVPLGKKYGVPVLADAAESVGASHNGEPTGSLGDGAILSFNGNKIMTTSGGGMFLTHTREHADYVRYLATQAREPAVHYEHVEVGYNYRLSSVSAALGRAQLVRLPEMIARRRAHRVRYDAFFEGVAGISLLPGDIEEDNCWLSSILVDEAVTGWGPLSLQAHFESLNIESRPLWKPMHLQPLFRDAQFFGSDVAENLFHSGLALPSGSAMSDGQMDRVLESISEFMTKST
jgi:dTDP-4-amino-4,6-dideoxygalactose transaminase